MATSIYTQVEIDQMLATPKDIELDAWEDRTQDRKRSPNSVAIEVSARDRDDMDFNIAIVRSPRIGSESITLIGKILGRDRRAIARYDIHDAAHKNPPWFDPGFIGPRQPHRHLYNERALKEDREWHACAEPLDLPDDAQRLLGKLLDDLNIRFSDSKTNTQLFGFMNI